MFVDAGHDDCIRALFLFMSNFSLSLSLFHTLTHSSSALNHSSIYISFEKEIEMRILLLPLYSWDENERAKTDNDATSLRCCRKFISCSHNGIEGNSRGNEGNCNKVKLEWFENCKSVGSWVNDLCSLKISQQSISLRVETKAMKILHLHRTTANEWVSESNNVFVNQHGSAFGLEWIKKS